MESVAAAFSEVQNLFDEGNVAELKTFAADANWKHLLKALKSCGYDDGDSRTHSSGVWIRPTKASGAHQALPPGRPPPLFDPICLSNFVFPSQFACLTQVDPQVDSPGRPSGEI